MAGCFGYGRALEYQSRGRRFESNFRSKFSDYSPLPGVTIHENGFKEKKTENRVKPTVARKPTAGRFGGRWGSSPENFEILVPPNARKSCFQQRKFTKIRFLDFEIEKKTEFSFKTEGFSCMVT